MMASELAPEKEESRVVATNSIEETVSVEHLLELLQRERHLRQLDVQEKAKIQRSRDQLALQIETLLEERLSLEEEGNDSGEDARGDEGVSKGTQVEQMEEEIDALQKDVDVLLQEVEEERRINKELEKMVKQKEYEKTRVENAMAKLESKFQKLKVKKKGVDTEEDMEDLVDSLNNKIAVLSASQNELIASLDGSADELDRLSKENRAMCDTIDRLKGMCEAYECQIEEHISVAEQLQQLLEEGSEWKVPLDSGRPLSLPPLRTSHGPAHASEEEYSIMKQEYQQTLVHYKALEDNVYQWQSKCAILQNQVMALCAQLTRVSGCASGMHSCIVPMLSDIEARLTSLV